MILKNDKSEKINGTMYCLSHGVYKQQQVKATRLYINLTIFERANQWGASEFSVWPFFQYTKPHSIK